jgi:hypothetical protein
LIAEGHTNNAFSSMLKLSVKTIETDRSAAMRKLGMQEAGRALKPPKALAVAGRQFISIGYKDDRGNFVKSSPLRLGARRFSR